MDELPDNPEEFAYAVANLLSGLRPESEVVYAGDLFIRIDGQRHDLTNLYKAVAIEPERGSEIVMEYLEKLFDFSKEEFDIDVTDFLDVVGRIMPRIVPDAYIESLPDEEMVTTIPWINNCQISFVIDYPQLTMSIRRTMLEGWGIQDPEDLMSFALKNLWSITQGIQFNILELKDDEGNGVAKACFLHQADGYDSSRILLPQMYQNLAPTLGSEYYVAIPSRDMFLAVANSDPQTLMKVHDRIQKDYVDLPHPVCPELFLCVRDGIAPGPLAPI